MIYMVTRFTWAKAKAMAAATAMTVTIAIAMDEWKRKEKKKMQRDAQHNIMQTIVIIMVRYQMCNEKTVFFLHTQAKHFVQRVHVWLNLIWYWKTFTFNTMQCNVNDVVGSCKERSRPWKMPPNLFRRNETKKKTEKQLETISRELIFSLFLVEQPALINVENKKTNFLLSKKSKTKKTTSLDTSEAQFLTTHDSFVFFFAFFSISANRLIYFDVNWSKLPLKFFGIFHKCFRRFFFFFSSPVLFYKKFVFRVNETNLMQQKKKSCT